MENKYSCHNRSKYSLKVHIVLVTKYRKRLLDVQIGLFVKSTVCDIAIRNGYIITAMETDGDHIHILLDYHPTDRICDIVKALKQQTTHRLWEQYHTYLATQYWGKRIFWSNGYFTCSVGEASAETIQRYIQNQG